VTTSPGPVAVVDTMVASALVNSRFDADRADQFRALVERRTIVVSFATVTELRFGAVKAGWAQLRVRGLERDLSRFLVVQPDDDLMHRCAELRFACERIGHPLGQKIHEADRWIAATAIAGEFDLISNDRAFVDTPGLSLLTTRSS